MSRTVIPFTARGRACCLRQWTLSDKTSLMQHANNRKVWRNLRDSFPHPYTESDADEWLKFSSGNLSCLAVVVESDAVGGIGYIEGTNADQGLRRAEIGFWLGEDYWGGGIMSAALAAFLPYAWAQLPNVIRLYTCQMAWNGASCRVMEKNGFTLEAQLKNWYFKDGQVVDCLMYALLRPEPSVEQMMIGPSSTIHTTHSAQNKNEHPLSSPSNFSESLLTPTPQVAQARAQIPHQLQSITNHRRSKKKRLLLENPALCQKERTRKTKQRQLKRQKLSERLGSTVQSSQDIKPLLVRVRYVKAQDLESKQAKLTALADALQPQKASKYPSLNTLDAKCTDQ